MKYMMRYASEFEVLNWDDMVLSNKKNPGMLQSRAFANIKSRVGWKPIYVVYESNNAPIFAFFLQKRIVGFGLLWYLPSESFSLIDIPNIIKANANFAKLNRLSLFLIKLDFYIIDSEKLHKKFLNIGLEKTQNIQPNTSTVELQLPYAEDDVFSSIFRRARKNINLAERQNLDIRRTPANEATFKKMYDLMKTVNGGKGASIIRPFSYYENFWTEFCTRGQGFFYFAFEEGKQVVGAFIVKFGEKAIYKDGGSTPARNTRNKYSHLIQWNAIKDMHKLGVVNYDLCGTPPYGHIADINHPFHGMGEFKTSFNNSVIDYCGTYDQILNKLKYKLWKNNGDKLIRKIYWSLKHDIYY